jgi:Leucine Rich repeats (2 copies)
MSVTGVLIRGTTTGAAHIRLSRSRAALRAAFLILVAWFVSTAVHAAVPSTERAVLDALYTSTNGAGWTVSTGWEGAAGTECSWVGITCDLAGDHIVGIDLFSDHLVGALPDLSGLPQLQSVVVDANALAGSLPSLAALSQLQTFTASSNNLTGSLPSLSGLPHLQYLDVAGNQISGPIPPLSGLSQLIAFSADGNRLTGSIPPLAGLANLVFLRVGGNLLTGPMPSLAGLTSLTTVDISNNSLSGPVAAPPTPSALAASSSSLCPNALIPAATPETATDSAWDAATGLTPWSTRCTGSVVPPSSGTTVSAPALSWWSIVALIAALIYFGLQVRRTFHDREE